MTKDGYQLTGIMYRTVERTNTPASTSTVTFEVHHTCCHSYR